MRRIVTLALAVLLLFAAGCQTTEEVQPIEPDENGMMQVGDHWIEAPDAYDEASVQRFAEKLQAVQAEYLTADNAAYYAVIPDKSWYAADRITVSLDHDAMTAQLQELMGDGIAAIDIGDLLQLEDYYLTDSHWRQEKLQPVAQRLAEAMGADLGTPEYTQQSFAPYIGGYGDSIAQPPEDTLIWLENETIANAYVDNFQQPEYHAVYEPEKLESATAYDMYLSGPTPLMTVTNENAATDKRLVLFRDSYGSSLAPLLLEGYASITLVDLRYMATQLIPEFVDFENADVLFLYSAAVVNRSTMLR